MTEHVSNNAAPKRPAVRETVSRKAREAQESAKATATLAGHTAKSTASTATSKATAFVGTATEKLPFDVPKVELPKVELPKFELPHVDLPSLDDLKRDAEKLGHKGVELAEEAKKAVASTVTLVREAVGR